MCRFDWMQWQLFEPIFVFLKPHCHFRLNKRILKILSIYRKNILGKYPLKTFSDCFMHQTFNIFHKIKNDDQSCQTVHCSDEYYGKTPMQESVFSKVSRIQAKERLLFRCFPVRFTKSFRTLFCKTPLGDCFC